MSQLRILVLRGPNFNLLGRRLRVAIGHLTSR